MSSKLQIYKGTSCAQRRKIKCDLAFEIMGLHFSMQQMGLAHLLNEEDAARYETLKQRYELLIKELYQYVKNDNDI